MNLPAINFAALAAHLRKDRQPFWARLVEFMADKSKADLGDVGEAVHGDRYATEKAIRENARRTNLSLSEIQPALSFCVMSGHLFREISKK